MTPPRGIRVDDSFKTYAGTTGIVVDITDDDVVTVSWSHSDGKSGVLRYYAVEEVYDSIRRGWWVECELDFL